MLSKDDIALIYETVLTVPGMNDFVKLDLKMTRKNVLTLSKIIERGMGLENSKGKETNILDIIPKETIEELKEVSFDLLQKAGLSEMNEKLKGF